MARNYWGYRVDTRMASYFMKQLDGGVLRQGWGWMPEQDLRSLTFDGGAKRNLAIFRKVKQGDILLVPGLPTTSQVAIVEATADFAQGYRFGIDEGQSDYGHQFPVRYLRAFNRRNGQVDGCIRSTLTARSRFWSLSHCADAIQKLLEAPEDSLGSRKDHAARYAETVQECFKETFDEAAFTKSLYQRLTEGFTAAEWEFALVEALQARYPAPCTVERVGGAAEAEHGCDILVRIPGLLDYEYLIAIQVKDYEAVVSGAPLRQLAKADVLNNESQRVIDKILIVTRANREDNDRLWRNEQGISVIFADELQQLLSGLSRAYLGLSAG